MDKREIYSEIEKLRSELTTEYEKCLDKAGMTPKVLSLSQKLDKLILGYVKMDSPIK